MSKTWVAADHHFGHKNIVKFLRDDGTKLRPFDTIEEHDNELVARHNAVVGNDDRVYCLGDFGNPRVVENLRGRLVLVKGNHDTDKLAKYSGFQDIRAYVVKKGFVMSHMPIHPASVKERWKINIHGHLHDGVVKIPHPGSIDYFLDPDPRYKCVSMEHTNYAPVDLNTILKEYDL